MADLQHTTALISKLTSKLAELDDKVAAYRLDMASEFSRHSEEVLRHVPEDVAYRVSQSISTALSNYPSLYPPGSPSLSPSPTSANFQGNSRFERRSPPPILPHTSGSPKDGSTTPSDTRGPHERELEFQGLFTPTYLPLLEKVDRPPHIAAPAQSATTVIPSKPATPEAATVDRQLSPGDVPASEPPRSHHRPSPLRHATNTSIDSAASDSSSVKGRKSALRRSSVASRPPDSPRDPRRVRFDFQGEEVLPSSSPQVSSNVLVEPDDTTAQSEHVEDSYISSLDIEGEDDSQLGLPKKVSSTQALRALSKAPLDEGTIWTIVNTESQSESSSNSDLDKVRRNTASNSTSYFDTQNAAMYSDKMPVLPAEARRQSRGKDNEVGQTQLRQAVAIKIEKEVDEEEDSDDDGNALFMISRKGGQKPSLPVSSKAASRKTVASPPQQQSPVAPMPIQARMSNQATAPAASPMPIQAGSYNQAPMPAASSIPIASSVSGQTDRQKKTSTTAKGYSATTTSSFSYEEKPKLQGKEATPKSTTHVDEHDEVLFDFDDDDESGKFKSAKTEPELPKKFLPETRDDETESENETETTESTAEKFASGEAELPNSPPMDIGKDQRAVTPPEHKIPNKVPRKPAGTRPHSTSIGTYDGRPVTPHVVKNRQLRDQIKNTEGEVPFFVGSVNGNSGVDASNVKSYQASVMSPTTASGGFASGSFAERLMWERSQGISYDSDGEGQHPGKGGDQFGDRKRSG